VFGFLNIAKPAGPTSHDIVAQIRRKAGRRIKVGHAGTLDPFAEGVLVVCLGPATRLADYVQAQPKQYRAVATLGATSSTDDPEGDIRPTPDLRPPEEQAVRQALKACVGEIHQTPPAHSAVHVGGKRAYELARSGTRLDLPPRPVTIHAIRLVEYAYPRLTLEVVCGSGTYIRSLVRDIGQALGVGAYCSTLTRTAVGNFRLQEALAPEHVDPARDLLPPTVGLPAMPHVSLAPGAARRLAMGREIPLTSQHLREISRTGPQDRRPSTEVAVLDQAGALLAIAALEDQAGILRPRKVLAAPPRS